MKKYRIGVDLGGTNIAAGIVDEGFSIVKKGSVKTDVAGVRKRSAEILTRSAAGFAMRQRYRMKRYRLSVSVLPG